MPDSLYFDGASWISVYTGSIVGTGAISAAGIVRITEDPPSSGGNMKRMIFSWAQPQAYGLSASAGDFANRPSWQSGTTAYAPTTGWTTTTTDNWILIGYCKPAGVSAGRIHKYVYDTGVWQHAAGSTNVVDSVDAFTNVMVGRGFGGYMKGNILIVGEWDRQLADAEFEALTPGSIAWVDANEAWRCYSSENLVSVARYGTAHEVSRTGTSLAVGEAPAIWSDEGVAGIDPKFVPTINLIER